MKIFIPSKGRPDRITTHLLFKNTGVDYKVVLHNDEERSYYLLNKTIDPSKIIVSGTPFGINNQRIWIHNNLVELGEWYLSLDDDIKKITGISDSLYDNDYLPTKEEDGKRFYRLFRELVDMKRFLEICQESIKKAEQCGAKIIGFASTENYYFRDNKYIYIGYVKGGAAIRKRDEINRFDDNLETAEDFGYSAECLLRDGTILRNNFVYIHAGEYIKGGIGSYKSRLPNKIKENEYLMKKYPGLFRYFKKSDKHPKSELVLNINRMNKLQNWRQFMLGQKVDNPNLLFLTVRP